jgi:hypothetical protein
VRERGRGLRVEPRLERRDDLGHRDRIRRDGWDDGYVLHGVRKLRHTRITATPAPFLAIRCGRVAGGANGVPIPIATRGSAVGRRMRRGMRDRSRTPLPDDQLAAAATTLRLEGAASFSPSSRYICAYSVVPAETSPRQAPLSAPRLSISCLNRSRSPRMRRASRPAEDPSCSASPSAW